jgi:hypothetical protein
MKRIFAAVIMVLVASSLCFAEEKAASTTDVANAKAPAQEVKKQDEKKVAKGTVQPKAKHKKVQKEQAAK